MKKILLLSSLCLSSTLAVASIDLSGEYLCSGAFKAEDGSQHHYTEKLSLKQTEDNKDIQRYEVNWKYNEYNQDDSVYQKNQPGKGVGILNNDTLAINYNEKDDDNKNQDIGSMIYKISEVNDRYFLNGAWTMMDGDPTQTSYAEKINLSSCFPL